jgi:hypothetical protein
MRPVLSDPENEIGRSAESLCERAPATSRLTMLGIGVVFVDGIDGSEVVVGVEGLGFDQVGAPEG